MERRIALQNYENKGYLSVSVFLSLRLSLSPSLSVSLFLSVYVSLSLSLSLSLHCDIKTCQYFKRWAILKIPSIVF